MSQLSTVESIPLGGFILAVQFEARMEQGAASAAGDAPDTAPVRKNLDAIRFDTLTNYSLAEILPTFLGAFADYKVPMKLSLQDLETMLTRRGYVASLSVAAFDDADGGRCVGFHLIGRGPWMDTAESTVNDTGTGVLPEYRNLGLSRRMFEWIVPHWREAGVEQCMLEVLSDNFAAQASYTKVGFRQTRHFDCLKLDIDMNATEPQVPADEWQVEISNNLPTEFATWLDDEPAWQNSLACMSRTPQQFHRCVLLRDGAAVAAGLVNPVTGEVPLFAVARHARKQGLGRELLIALRRRSDLPLRFINLTMDGPAAALIRKLGGQSLAEQFEMCWKL
jgi:GNAT superfamily N-acetyltransferase